MPQLNPMAADVIRWRPEYSVGVDEIDREHQHLFALADGLYTEIRKGTGQDGLTTLLDDLLAYTSDHFAHEEALMGKINYPYREEHCHEHESLRHRVLSMKEQAEGGENDMAIQIMNCLVAWLRYHTTTSDRRIGTYMRRYGLVS